MIRATRVATAGAWSGAPADYVNLDYDSRFRRRIAMQGESGLNFLLDLLEATELRDGDALALEDGRIIAVRAAPEAVADLACRDAHHLVRVAWHLGNRHLPTQIFADRLRIRQDHVIEAMAEGLGATVTRLAAPFDPEGGAYGQGRTHSHAHSHGHGDRHARSHGPTEPNHD